MASLDYQEIKLPNLLQHPYVVQQVELNGILYFFEYMWNIRHEKAYLSIYSKISGIDFYLVRNVCLICGLELSKHILDEDWQGRLFFAPDSEYEETEYRVDNFHDKFHINYFS